MKDSNVIQIQKIGKIGYIITNIIYSISIAVLIISMIITLFLASLPNNFLTISNNATKTITINLEGMNETISIDQDSLKILDDEYITLPSLTNSIEYRLKDISTNGNDLSLISEYSQDNKDLKNYAMAFFIIDLGIIFEIIVIYYVRKLFKNFKVCNTPFSENSINILSKISISLIPLAIYYLIGDTLIQATITDQFNLLNELNISGFVSISLIYIIITIFKYGTKLQIESDEIL